MTYATNSPAETIKRTLLGLTVLLFLAGCQFGTAPQGGGDSEVTGGAIKGRFTTGATVTCKEVNPPNRSVSGTIIDNNGNYRCRPFWNGPTFVEVTGPFIDDFTGAVTTQPASSPLRAVINAQAGGAATGNVNVATSIAAQVIASQASAGTTITTTGVNAQNLATAQRILGSSTTTNINDVNLSNTSSSAASQLVAFLLAVTAQSGVSNVATAISQLANNQQNSVPFGTAVSGASLITPTQLSTNLATIRDGGTLSVTGVGSVSTATALANLGTGQTTTQLASQVDPNNVATVTTGFAINSNSVTIGSASGTLGISSGVGTATISGTTANSNVSLSFNVLDFTNSTGTGPGPATTYNTVFTFFFQPTSSTDSRRISGTVSTVSVVTNGSGGLTVSVPASATMTFSGTTATGSTVSGTVTNLATDSSFFTAGTTTSSGTPVTINANTLLNLIQNRVGGSLLTLTTSGTFNFAFGFSIPIGTANSGNTGPSQLLPQGTNAPGYGFSGTMTLT